MIKRYTHEDFLERARKLHGDVYQYVSKYQSSRKKMQIQCSKHGMFEQVPQSHLKGHGCVKCSHVRETTDSWIRKAQLMHALEDDPDEIANARLSPNEHIREFARSFTRKLSSLSSWRD